MDIPRVGVLKPSMWIVWMCETVAYSEGVDVETKLRLQLLLPKNNPKLQAR